MKKYIKPLISLLLAAVFAFMPAMEASARKVPYRGYSYDNMRFVNAVPARLSYIPATVIDGVDLGVGSWSSPQDVQVYEEWIYVSDTGNNRIVVFNRYGELKEDVGDNGVVTTFINNGEIDTFNAQDGLCIPRGMNRIYVCDTENRRILVFDMEFNLLGIVDEPDSDMLMDYNIFRPVKITVDNGGRMYVRVRNMFQGLLCFNDDLTFNGYFGQLPVRVSAWDLLWRRIYTREQIEKNRSFIPTEFTNVDIDEHGFIYCTNIDVYDGDRVKILNPFGTNILKNYNENRNIVGDLLLDAIAQNFMSDMGANTRSRLEDIKARPAGMYTVVDSRKGRLFTYDGEGNLLYIFGGNGSQFGMFRKATALDILKENFDEIVYNIDGLDIYRGDDVIVLDELRANVTIFEPTLYGAMINTAISLRYDGDEGHAVEIWREILRLDNNFMMAYVGIGKSLLAEGENRDAMLYLRAGNDIKYYSVAYRRYRTEVMNNSMPVVMTGLFIVIGLYYGTKLTLWILRKQRERRVEHEHGGV
ncbi:MAG: gluconolactonase [Defluviitaleaceae bacterium]|nr:gluconolactonase [Defluviitaleaceae bacterium]